MSMESQLLPTDDPNLAVILERLTVISITTARNAEINTLRMDKMEAQFMARMDHSEKITTDRLDKQDAILSNITALMTKMRGGWIVILAMGALIAYSFGLLDKIKHFFSS